MTASAPPADPIPTTLATEPARAFGYTGSVIGLIVAVVSYFLPIDPTIKPLIPGAALLLIPVIIAELTRLKVFSPATVDRIRQVLQGQIDTSTTIAQSATASAAANQAALTAVQTAVADSLQALLNASTQQSTVAATSAMQAAAATPPPYPFPTGAGAPAPQPAMARAQQAPVWLDGRHNLR